MSELVVKNLTKTNLIHIFYFLCKINLPKMFIKGYGVILFKDLKRSKKAHWFVFFRLYSFFYKTFQLRYY